MTIKQSKLIENYIRSKVRNLLNEETFNIDRTKNLIGTEVFNAIGKSNKSQLEKWLKDVDRELNSSETSNTPRRNRLMAEKKFIEYRLEI